MTVPAIESATHIVATEIYQHEFENGLTLLAEPMPWLESAALFVSLPGGCQADPAGQLGLANFTCEMVQRGCGTRDSRAFLEELEFHGIDYSASVSAVHTSFGASMPSESLPKAIELMGDMLRRPHLPHDQMEDGRRVCLQEIYSIEDDLPQRAMIELRRRRCPAPLGRNSVGTIEGIAAIGASEIGQFFDSHYRPNHTIIGVAGKLDWEVLKETIAEHLADWQSGDAQPVELKPAIRGISHIEHESNQTHIALSYDTVPYSHPNYFLARGAVGVLSDGMSSRLFTEIREKRGLCYSVYASYHSLKEMASIVSYAGTSTERAQETLDVLYEELQKIQSGITEAELSRLKTQIRSGLVMQQESSRSRAGTLVSDWYYLSKVRSLDEITSIILSLTCEAINGYLSENPPQNFTLVTLGAEPLETPVGISSTTTG